MTTPREIYEKDFGNLNSIPPPMAFDYGEACWRAGLRAAIGVSPRESLDHPAYHTPTFWSGVVAQCQAIQKLLSESKDINQDPAPKSDEPFSGLSSAWTSLDSAYRQGHQDGLRATLKAEPDGASGSRAELVRAHWQGVDALRRSIWKMIDVPGKPKKIPPPPEISGPPLAPDIIIEGGKPRPAVEAAPGSHDHDLSEGEMIIAHWGSVAAQLEAIRRLLVAPGDPPTPRPPLPIDAAFGCDPQYIQAIELATRHGYQRARTEAIRTVKRMRTHWEEPGPFDRRPPPNPYATVDAVLNRLERLDPDSPPEEEASHD